MSSILPPATPEPIAKIVGSTDHATYVASELPSMGPNSVGGEVREETPHIHTEFGIGSYVRIGGEVGQEAGIIGMIVSTRLVPDDGFDLGTFQGKDLELFTPELGNASQRLLIIAGLGECTETGELKDGLPSRGPGLHDPIHLLPDEEIIALHRKGGSLNLSYLPYITRSRDPQRIESALRGLKKLKLLLPAQGPVLDLLIQEMEWDARVQR